MIEILDGKEWEKCLCGSKNNVKLIVIEEQYKTQRFFFLCEECRIELKQKL